MSKKQAMLVNAAIAGLLLTGANFGFTQNAVAAGDKCYGVNKCKGTGACGGKGHSCAGKNACKGQGWLSIDEENCNKIEGGSTKPAEEGEKEKKK